ncbi:hypothetical protein [Streptomyces zhihengii]|uniref:N-acetyltransferase domain-containing protein n=1 Tax=Streptomyces zhihengii TaxID=1818004 RepID=A0ABS2UM03_9ACTN|nr:hypothetical protein [Streptomyces zhihengii]MBM9618368.1 hypothetical protein [Streptomyces zhihengii]
MTGHGHVPRTAETERLRRALDIHGLVNLTGPPGAGKSALAGELGWKHVDLEHLDLKQLGPEHLAPDLGAPDLGDVDLGGPQGAGGAGPDPAACADDGVVVDGVVVDGVDGPGRAAALSALLGRARPRRLLLISRRPLPAQDGWTGHGVHTVRLPPLPDEDVDRLAGAAGIGDPGARALVVRLAGGVPALAHAACRALHAGATAADPGAVADRMADELTDRLARERPGARTLHALRLLATVGAGDEHLLSAGPGLITRLGRLSVVRGTALGLTLAEPFRTVLETAYHWRRPLAHHTVRSRAAAYRHTLLQRSEEPSGRAELVRQGLFLTGDPALRSALFPPAESSVTVGAATPDDTDAICVLMRRWAERGGFDRTRADRITERWLAHGPSAFRLARDGDGRAIGLASLLPVGDGTSGGVDQLLQQHAEQFVTGRRTGGLFLGAAYAPDPVAHSRVLGDILERSVHAGRLVVSTATDDYQRLVRVLGFQVHGAVRDDVFRCGRPPEVSSNVFTPAALGPWLDRLGPAAAAHAQAADERLVPEVARALARLGDPAGPVDSALLAYLPTPTPAALRRWLRDAAHDLATGDDAADAEAGAVLCAYYLGRSPVTHHQVAGRLHLGRATYFRRHRRGLLALAARLRAGG